MTATSETSVLASTYPTVALMSHFDNYLRAPVVIGSGPTLVSLVSSKHPQESTEEILGSMDSLTLAQEDTVEKVALGTMNNLGCVCAIHGIVPNEAFGGLWITASAGTSYMMVHVDDRTLVRAGNQQFFYGRRIYVRPGESGEWLFGGFENPKDWTALASFKELSSGAFK